MNFIDHRNYGVATALSVSVGYYVFHAANYYAQSGLILFSEKLLIASLIMMLSTFSGSLFPDLDTASIPSKWTARFLSVYIGLILLSGELIDKFNYDVELHTKPALILAFIFVLCKGDKHRGITHALLWIPGLIGLGLFTGNHYLIGFAIGLFTHLVVCDKISIMNFRNWI